MTTYAEQNAENPEAIKAEIERTRSQMSSKIDTLQERLHPDNLKHQAQEALQSAVQEGADSLRSYVREHSTDLRDAVVDSFKRNPVPTALVGLGIGWILLESLGSRDQRDATQKAWPRASDRERFTNEWAQQNRSEYNRSYSGYAAASQPSYVGQGDDRDPDYRGTDYRGAEGRSRDVSNGHSQGLGEKAQQLGDTVKDKASQAVDQIQDTANHLASEVSDKTQEWSHEARTGVMHLGDQTGRQVKQAGRQAQHLLEENPLAVGAAALALGAVIGLLLPATQRENQLVGELRDDLVEKGKAVASDVSQRVQEVVEEVKPEVERIANRAITDLKPQVEELGQKVTNDLKQAGDQALNSSGRSSEWQTTGGAITVR